MERLVCTGCGREADGTAWQVRCGTCGEPLAVGPPRGGTVREGAPLLLRFANFLPAEALGLHGDPGSVLTLGEGNTPLLPLESVGRQMGVPRLLVKVEGANPTGSFKDRGSAAGVQRARALGFRRVGTVSTGNMASSMAAYGARAGLRAVVLVPAGIPRAKLAPIAAYNPLLIGVEGDYGRLYQLSLELGPELGIAFVNSDDPYRVEGQKTLALELWQQLRRQVPDVVVVPVSSGGHMAALLKGFQELHQLGYTERVPRLVGVQAAGAAPIATAYQQGAAAPVPWGEPTTVARAIANPKPPSGRRLLRAARAGAPLHFVTVTDEEILAAYHALARGQGLFVQPDAAASVAAVGRLKDAGFVRGDETVVAVLTGHGTKDLTPLEQAGPVPLPTCTLDELPAVLAREA
ncbi:MAG TPA: threonine synthase [Limnochordales bacterium]|nr:threonine synthase [Limnochordales bacterium]